MSKLDHLLDSSEEATVKKTTIAAASAKEQIDLLLKCFITLRHIIHVKEWFGPGYEILKYADQSELIDIFKYATFYNNIELMWAVLLYPFDPLKTTAGERVVESLKFKSALSHLVEVLLRNNNFKAILIKLLQKISKPLDEFHTPCLWQLFKINLKEELQQIRDKDYINLQSFEHFLANQIEDVSLQDLQQLKNLKLVSEQAFSFFKEFKRNHDHDEHTIKKYLMGPQAAYALSALKPDEVSHVNVVEVLSRAFSDSAYARILANNKSWNQLRMIELFDGGKSIDGWWQIAENLIHNSPPNIFKSFTNNSRHAAIIKCLEQKDSVSSSPLICDLNKLITEGWEFLRFQGRTALFKKESRPRFLAFKVEKKAEPKSKLEMESNLITFLNPLRNQFASELPLAHGLQRLDLKTLGSIAHRNGKYDEYIQFAAMIESTDPDGYVIAYVYEAPPHYFTYLHDRSISQPEFILSNRIGIHDLTYFFCMFGIAFDGMVDLFHHSQMHGERPRTDQGRYILLSNLLSRMAMGIVGSAKPYGSGDVEAWQKSISFPNFRDKSISDLVDCVPLDSLSSQSEFANQYFSDAALKYPDKIDLLLAAELLARYPYGLFLIAARYSLEQNDKSLDAELLMRNCAYIISRVTGENEIVCRHFLKTMGNQNMIARQTQFWTSTEYIPWVKQNFIPHDVYGPDVDVRVDLSKIRAGTFKEGIGYSNNGIDSYLGSANGQEPLKATNHTIYTMINTIFTLRRMQFISKEIRKAMYQSRANLAEVDNISARLMHFDAHILVAKLVIYQRTLLNQRINRADEKAIKKAFTKLVAELSAVNLQRAWRNHQLRMEQNQLFDEVRKANPNFDYSFENHPRLDNPQPLIFTKLARRLIVGVSFDDLMRHINVRIARYGISSGESVLFHALFQFAQVPAAAIEIERESDHSPSFTIILDSSSVETEKFGNNLRAFLIGQAEVDKKAHYVFSVKNILQNISLIESEVDKILSVPRNVLAHQLYMSSDELMCLKGTRRFKELVDTLESEIPTEIRERHADYIEHALLKAFGYTGELKAAYFRNGNHHENDLIGDMLDTNLYLLISEPAARKLVNDFNNHFPNVNNPARFIASHVKFKGRTDFCQIAIDTGTLFGHECRELLKVTFNKMLAEKTPLPDDQLHLDSSSIHKSTAKPVQEFKNQSHPVKQEPKLAKALSNFSVIITNPHRTQSDGAVTHSQGEFSHIRAKL